MHPNLYLILLCFVALMQLGSSASIEKRTIDDCYGTDCYVDVDYYDNTRNIHLLASINDSVVPALPEIVELLMSDNANHDELVSLIQDQQRTQERLVTLLSSMMQIQQDTHQQLVIMTNFQRDTHQQLVNMTNLQHNTHQQLVNMTNRHQDTHQQLVNITNILQRPLQVQEVLHMQDCSNAPSTGTYTISPEQWEITPVNPFRVVCSMDTTSGGWVVIQRRFDGSVSFDRNWADYENGFGSLEGEFWLGLSKMHLLTSRGSWKLRFDLEDFDGNRAYAEYDYFQVGNGASFYQLTIRSYSGTAGDAMIASHDLNGMAFTTKDQDHDQSSPVNCGIHRRSGWWHKHCARSNANGLYLGQGGNSAQGMTWYEWKQQWNALKKTELKIKRVE